MTEEKWKSPTGHPISSSETDAFNTRANEPETVTWEGLKTSLENDGYYTPDGFGLLNHLRAQYPNGVKMTNKDALEAFKRISSDAIYGIGSGDYEIMNKGGFDEDMERHNRDAEIVRQALEVNQELEAVARLVVNDWEELGREFWGMPIPIRMSTINLAKQALAKAEGGKNE